MQSVILAVLSILLLTAWGPCSPKVPAPIEAACDQMCFVDCRSTAQWGGDPSDPKAWDALAGETVPALREETRQCNVKRKACVECLRRLDRHGVIFLNEPEN